MGGGTGTGGQLDKIDELIRDNIKYGSILEIVLLKGAGYDNGVSAGGWGEYECDEGFYFSSETLEEPGLKLLGYLKYTDKHIPRGIILVDSPN